MQTEKIKTAYNIRLAIGGLNGFVSTEVQNSTSVPRINVSAKNPAHRQPAGRCRAFKKKQTVNKKLKYGILTIGVIILIGFVFKGKITHEKFDSDKWKNWTESETEWSLRWDMINSLRNNYELKGMSQKQIIELLGEPESKTDSEFAYYLGYSKRGINTGRLTIKFKNNKVTDFQVLDG